MGNCYIFNPAMGIVNVTVNNVALGPIAEADPDTGYVPQSMTVTTAKYDDEGQGIITITGQNVLSFYYPDDPNQQFGPYSVQVCFGGLSVSVDDDLILYAGRPPAQGSASIVVMNKRGFVLDTRCSSALAPSGAEKGGA